MLLIERGYYEMLISEYYTSDYFGTLHDFVSDRVGTSMWTVTSN